MFTPPCTNDYSSRFNCFLCVQMIIPPDSTVYSMYKCLPLHILLHVQMFTPPHLTPCTSDYTSLFTCLLEYKCLHLHIQMLSPYSQACNVRRQDVPSHAQPHRGG